MVQFFMIRYRLFSVTIECLILIKKNKLQYINKNKQILNHIIK